MIANTDEALARWQTRFPSRRDKVHLIWNGFDAEERVRPLALAAGDCKILSHVGELYHGRTATPLLESVARLIATNRLTKRSLRVRLVGQASAEYLPSPEFTSRARSAGWLDLVTERIPQSEARRIAQSSSHLLLLQTRSTDQVPAKLFEYLQIGRPILAFIQPNSPTERLLEGSGVPYRCVYPNAVPGVIDDTVVDFLGLSSAAVAASHWFDEQFNAEHQTRALDEIIRSLHGGERPDWDSRNVPRIPGPPDSVAFQKTAHG